MAGEVSGARFHAGGARGRRTLLRRLLSLVADVRLEGLENLPAGGCVVAGNHRSVLDGPLIALLLPDCVLFAADDWVRRTWVRPFLTTAGGVIGVRRGEQDAGAIELAVRLLREGRQVVLAPEGRVTRTGGLQRGRAGAARLALGAGVPVVPLGWHGQEHLGRRARPTLHVRFGRPLTLDPAVPVEESVERVMLAIAGLLPAELRGVYAVSRSTSTTRPKAPQQGSTRPR